LQGGEQSGEVTRRGRPERVGGQGDTIHARYS
jgi:hypothetical protein